MLLIFREIGIENIDKIVFWDRESALYQSGKARLMNQTTWCFPPGYRSVKPAEGYVNETICVIEEALATYVIPDEAADHLTQWISALRELASRRQGSSLNQIYHLIQPGKIYSFAAPQAERTAWKIPKCERRARVCTPIWHDIESQFGVWVLV